MTLSLIVGVACLLIGFLIGQLIRTVKVKEKNQELEKEEQQVQLRIKDLEKDYIQKNAELERQYTEASEQCVKDLEKQNKHMTDAFNEVVKTIENEKNTWEKEKNDKLVAWLQREQDLKKEVSVLNTQIEERKKFIDDTQKEADTLQEQTYDLMVRQLLEQTNTEIDHCRYLSAQAQEEYEQIMRENTEYYLSKIDELAAEYERMVNCLDEAKNKAEAAIEVNKRAELERQEKNFYRLQLDEIDIEEIKRIRSIEPYLRKKEPLNKVIWKVYYEKPCTDMIGRVVGLKKKTGIYKITNIENGMCYIGQAVDIAERWKQHIKRGIGADTPTQNKLYPTMLSIGVENFMFEIIEECSSDKLTEREKYWTDFYKAQEFGYVVRKG